MVVIAQFIGLAAARQSLQHCNPHPCSFLHTPPPHCRTWGHTLDNRRQSIHKSTEDIVLFFRSKLEMSWDRLYNVYIIDWLIWGKPVRHIDEWYSVQSPCPHLLIHLCVSPPQATTHTSHVGPVSRTRYRLYCRQHILYCRACSFGHFSLFCGGKPPVN